MRRRRAVLSIFVGLQVLAHALGEFNTRVQRGMVVPTGVLMPMMDWGVPVRVKTGIATEQRTMRTTESVCSAPVLLP